MAEKQLIAADSFAGIPPNTQMRHDPVDLWPDRRIASLDEVKANVAEAGMQDGRIEFLQGFFGHTLPGLAGRRFSFIRLDSDSHDSVMDSLEWLYPLLNPGGVILLDDWHLFGCRVAIDSYRKHHNITDPIEVRAGDGFWIKR
jgi:O-methyltransferase/8-demethyl-8-(2,3-dimethoxy-alpha-L-rhamnosyl)tetracenomycin-C 4'-O-methyltransferase